MNLNRGGGLFAEFVYHIVEREADVEDTENEDNEPFSANNWAIHVGSVLNCNNLFKKDCN